MYRYTKRIFDIAIAGASLLLVAPICLVVALFVRINLGSPVLYRQTRPGFNGDHGLCRFGFRTAGYQ